MIKKIKEMLKRDNTLYAVSALRWGSMENHSYIVGIYSKYSKSVQVANDHANYRGGKYACIVEKMLLDGSHEHMFKKELYRVKSLQE